MIYIALGSNLGNRLSNLRKAVALLKAGILQHTCESIIIETEALLKDGAPDKWNKPYLNMIIAGESALSAENLLKSLKGIEQQLGKEPNSEKWAPRIIDLDIIIYNDQNISSPGLKIPHPELLNRDFLIHLLGLMTENYMPKLQVNGKSVRADEYAHEQINCTDLFSNTFVLGPQIVGVLNITQDSFSDGGKNFEPEIAIKNAYKIVKDGAEIIDIGAQSTRPGGIEIIGPEKEYERLAPVLDGLKNINAKISIDSYHPELIRKILKNYQIDWINDVTGNLDDNILKEIASSGAKILTMHSLSVPPSRDKTLPHDSNIVHSLQRWSEKMLEQMLRCGFNADDLILDPGIGFGKSIYQNLTLIKEIKNLQKNGFRFLIGHSRKSFMQGFFDGRAPDRDIETITISNNLAKSGIDFIRVHNVRDHYRLFVADKVSSI